MKIRTKKKMRLDELIKYVFDNGITGKRFEERLDYKSYSITHAVHVTGNGVMNVEGLFNPDTKFTVDVEEELTEETEFEELWEVYYNKSDGEIDTYKNGETNGFYSTSISRIMQENSIDGDNITLAIYYGSTLIWAKDLGIPGSCVLEVYE